MLLVASHAVLFVPYSASAASIYDDAYISTNDPRLVRQTLYNININSMFGNAKPDNIYEFVNAAIDATNFDTGNGVANYGGILNQSGISNQAFIESYYNRQNSTVTEDCTNPNGFGGYDYCQIVVLFSETENMSLEWTENGVTVQRTPGLRMLTIATNTSSGSVYRIHMRDSQAAPNYYEAYRFISRSDSTSFTSNIITDVANENIPEDYQGDPLITGGGGTGPGNTICPVYQVTVAQNGLLRIVYEGNISPFLTGISYIVVNETYDQWTTLGPEIMNESVNPAGWLDWSGDVLLAPNTEYVIRISHNQQLDSPPWTTQPTVDDVWVQVLYNGETQYTFTTKGCGSEITNPITFEGNEMESIFERLSLDEDEFGLGAAVTAPLQFIGNLPVMAESCMPLVLPLPFVNSNITLPCMTPIYQDKFPQILNIFQTVMLGLFGYYAAVKVYGNIKQLKDPRDDQIEVVKL